MQPTVSLRRSFWRGVLISTPMLLFVISGVLLIIGLNLSAEAQSPVLEKFNRSAAKANTAARVTASEEGEVDVATLTDAEVRRLLLERLREDDAKASTDANEIAQTEGLFVRVLAGVQSATVTLSTRTRALATAVSGAADEWRIALRNLTDDQGYAEVFKALLIFVVMLAGGLFAEHRCRKSVAQSLQAFYAQLVSAESSGWLNRLQAGSGRLLLELVLIGTFTLVTYILSFVFFDRFQPLRIFVTTYLLVITSVRVVAALSRFLISPKLSELRLLPLKDEQAVYAHHWLIVITTFAAFGFFTCGLLTLLGVSDDLHLFLNLMVGTGITLLFLLTLVRRKRDWYEHSQGNENDLLISGIWFVSTLVFIVVVWGAWVVNHLLSRPDFAGSAVNSLLLLAALPIVDYMVKGFLSWLFGLRECGEEERLEHARYAAVFQNVVRVLLFGVVMYVLANAMGLGVLDGSGSGRSAMFLSAGFNITVTLLLAYIVWEMVKILTGRHTPEPESAEKMMSMDGEGGEVAPTTRLETLMPLLRSVVLVTLIIAVVMIALSSIGINIGPLIAGAGVIGLAIGFGAQKLVQDVISGIFFLLDDAFRVGEYIEAADMTGTVENITIRSMRLRHHLGPVQTIPYSEVSTVKNHSRDYIIMKLRFRVPYDTDIEKVRKTIKKIGQELMQDKDLGPGIIAPLKSQGVLEMEDSAMVMRMKFTAKPGEQWVLRREAYKRVRDALMREGIEFAHRQVTVHVADTENSKIAGAAAAAIAQEEQETRNTDDKGKSDDMR